MKDFIKKYGTKISIVLLLLFVITYLWFIVRGGLPTGDGLNKRDWLAFWGSFLSFGGSVLLGAVSVWQNVQANETNEKMLKESQRLSQVEFENDIKRNQYMRIITGAQQIGQRVGDICIQLSTINIELRKEPDAQFVADLLAPIITSAMTLREMEIDSIIPVGYDDLFPIIQKNRTIIKTVLQKNEDKMNVNREELRQQVGKVSGEYAITVTIADIKVALSEIISHFNSLLDKTESYKSFVEEESNE